MDGTLFHNKVIRVKEKKSPDESAKNNFNVYNNINFLPYLNNKFINSFYTDMKLEEENSSNFNDDSTFSGQEKDQDLFSSHSSNSQKRSFSENIEIIENDDHIALNSKAIDSVNKLYEHERSNKKVNEISNLILYYSSNYNKYNNNDNYMC